MTWEAKQQPPPAAPEAVERKPVPAAPGTPAAPPPSPADAPEKAPAPASPVAPAPTTPEETFEVSNDLYRAVFTSRGAGISHFELQKYRAPRSEGGGPVVLIDRASGDAAALATPMTELGLGDLSSAVFRIAARGPDEVAFEHTHSGVRVRKSFRLDPASYLLRVRVEVASEGASAVSPSFGVLLPVRVQPGSDFRELNVAALVAGTVERQPIASFGQPSFFSRNVELERRFAGELQWAGAHSHYFLVATIPDLPRDARTQWLAVRPSEEAFVTVDQPAVAVLPGTALAREYSAFLGPKEPELLEAAGAQLERSIDLGWTWVAPLTRFFIWLLKACYAVIPNYGVAIIIMTVLVRLVTAPLAARQMRSM
jgi:YidC/Oxa1 family membrane protein insertase